MPAVTFTLNLTQARALTGMRNSSTRYFAIEQLIQVCADTENTTVSTKIEPNVGNQSRRLNSAGINFRSLTNTGEKDFVAVGFDNR